MSKFAIDEYGGHDKAILVQGPGDLRLMVDYDDVFHPEVDILIDFMLEILNRDWYAVTALACVRRNDDEFDWDYEACFYGRHKTDSGLTECPGCGGPLEEFKIG